MTDQQLQVKQWMTSFGQETPEKPTIPSLEVRKLRAKLILEEALETVNALGLKYAHMFGTWEEHPETLNLLEIADGCEDLKVVTEGTLIACGLANKNTVSERQGYDPLFDEVMRSNNSKMWTEEEVRLLFNATGMLDAASIAQLEDSRYPGWTIIRVTDSDRCFLVKDTNGKVIKSPSYSPANLQPIIDEMSK